MQARDDLLKKVKVLILMTARVDFFHNLLQNYTFSCSFLELKVTKSQFRKELMILSVSPKIKLYYFTGLVF